MGAYFLISMLYIGQDIILPVIYATILAIAISPAVNYLVRININRILAIFVVFLAAVIIIVALVGLISMRASSFSESLPELADKFQHLLNQLVSWASGYFNIRTLSINTWIDESKVELLSHTSSAIGSTLQALGYFLEAATFVLVYICMILYYQLHFTAFIHKLFSADDDSRVSEILKKTKKIIQAYLSGLFFEFVIMAVLNSIGLLLLGIDYAIVLGIIGALLNIIPFIGGIVAVILYMVIALISKEPIYILYVAILYSAIQLIDNNYIVPKIIGSKVKLNAPVALIAVIAGAALWGIPGMFLSIPLIAIIKLICDHIDSLKPWGFLLGDESPSLLIIKSNFRVKGMIKVLTKKK